MEKYQVWRKNLVTGGEVEVFAYGVTLKKAMEYRDFLESLGIYNVYIREVNA